MGNCCVRVKIARDRMTQRKRRNIVLLLVGLDKAGKTTAAKGLVGEKTGDEVPTVGFSTFTQFYKGYTVIIYDLGGGPQIRGIWNRYFSDVHGIIYVVDASDLSRIDESRFVLEQLLTHEKLAGKPLLLLANKQDREAALDEIDVVERLKLERIVNQQKCPTLVETCSALTNNSASNKAQLDPGIQNGYRWLLSIIMKEFKIIDARVETDTQIAKLQSDLEKRERKRRIEEQHREKEELEGTVIIPLKDDYSETSNIIQVKSLSVESDPVEEETEVKVPQSDSHDSGYTMQNIEDYEAQSLESILSQDSVVQIFGVKECLEHIEEKENSSSSPSSGMVPEVEESQPKASKSSRFLKHSNKTAPAPTGVLLLGNKDSLSSSHHRHKLPPLTPSAGRKKLFEAKSSKSVSHLRSLSLSSDDSDNRKHQCKTGLHEENSNISQTAALANANFTRTDQVTLNCRNIDKESRLKDSDVSIIPANGEVQSDVFDVFTIKSSKIS